MLIPIASDFKAATVDHSFRVEAGPGAGKTKWLISHIEHTLATSKKLGVTRKVACITYTNVAVETIIRRLGMNAERVVVSTIHSFLYQNLIKPYFHFIAGEYGFPIRQLDGHDDPFVNRKTVKDWIQAHPSQASLKPQFTAKQLTILPNNLLAAKNWLETLSPVLTATADDVAWTVNNRGAIMWDGTKHVRISATALNTLATDLDGYKKMLWREGNLCHDDVLYFSFKLINRFPFLLTVLQAKYPYIYCDEFQDINPIQRVILQKISAAGSVVGIIGDRAQSIYSFQGADPKQFDTFFTTAIDSYKIEDNWRSTKSIVSLLNHIRKDIQQVPKRPDQGGAPTILVGDRIEAYTKACELCGTTEIACLTRDNLTANIMRKRIATAVNGECLHELRDKDGQRERRNAVEWCIEAIDAALAGYFKEALKIIGRLPLVKASGDPRKTALQILKTLVDKQGTLRQRPILDLYNFIVAKGIAALPRFSGANPKGLYEVTTFDELSAVLQSLDERTPQRTIHKSKGDEFPNVLLILREDTNGTFNEKTALDFILSPDLRNEEQRIKYVAVSRARDSLLISVPTLSNIACNALQALGCDIVNIPIASP